jgi:hypothetical protein
MVSRESLFLPSGVSETQLGSTHEDWDLGNTDTRAVDDLAGVEGLFVGEL